MPSRKGVLLGMFGWLKTIVKHRVSGLGKRLSCANNEWTDLNERRMHRRQRHRGCRGSISGSIWSVGDEMSYMSPKVCQNCYQIACRTDAYGATCNQRLRYKQDTETVRERMIVFRYLFGGLALQGVSGRCLVVTRPGIPKATGIGLQ